MKLQLGLSIHICTIREFAKYIICTGRYAYVVPECFIPCRVKNDILAVYDIVPLSNDLTLLCKKYSEKVHIFSTNEDYFFTINDITNNFLIKL